MFQPALKALPSLSGHEGDGKLSRVREPLFPRGKAGSFCLESTPGPLPAGTCWFLGEASCDQCLGAGKAVALITLLQQVSEARGFGRHCDPTPLCGDTQAIHITRVEITQPRGKQSDKTHPEPSCPNARPVTLSRENAELSFRACVTAVFIPVSRCLVNRSCPDFL